MTFTGINVSKKIFWITSRVTTSNSFGNSLKIYQTFSGMRKKIIAEFLRIILSRTPLKIPLSIRLKYIPVHKFLLAFIQEFLQIVFQEFLHFSGKFSRNFLEYISCNWSTGFFRNSTWFFLGNSFNDCYISICLHSFIYFINFSEGILPEIISEFFQEFFSRIRPMIHRQFFKEFLQGFI